MSIEDEDSIFEMVINASNSCKECLNNMNKYHRTYVNSKDHLKLANIEYDVIMSKYIEIKSKDIKSNNEDSMFEMVINASNNRQECLNNNDECFKIYVNWKNNFKLANKKYDKIMSKYIKIKSNNEVIDTKK